MRCGLSVGKVVGNQLRPLPPTIKMYVYSSPLRSLDINNSFNVSIAFLSSDVFCEPLQNNNLSTLLRQIQCIPEAFFVHFEATDHGFDKGSKLICSF